MIKKLRHAIYVGTLCTGSVVTGSSYAQSSVSLYGIIDTNIEWTNNNAVAGSQDGGSRLRLASGGLQGPRWGIRGTESLGNGLSALFVLENGFNPDTGAAAESTRLFNRLAVVGIESSAGKVTLGRHYTSLFEILLPYSPLMYSGTYEPMPYIVGQSRTDNSVKYSYQDKALRFQAHYAFGETPGSLSPNAAWGVGASYTLPAGITLLSAFDQANGPETTNSYTKSRKALLAATYQWRTVGLYAGYRWAQDKAASGATTFQGAVWWLGASWAATPSLKLSAALYLDDPGTQAAGRQNAQQFVLQAIQALSKRTDTYAAFGHTRNAGLNFAALSTLAANEHNQSGFAVGIRHRF